MKLQRIAIYFTLIVLIFACKKDSELIPEITVSFTYSPEQDLKAPLEITFIAEAQNANSYTWDFGDGTTGEGISVKHTYQVAGEYAVVLIAKGENNTNAVSSKILNVAGQTIGDDFEFTNENQQFLSNVIEQLRLFDVPDIQDIMEFPVKAHIVRKDDGSGNENMTESRIITAIQNANQVFINAQIQFFLCGEVNYINNTDFYNESTGGVHSYARIYEEENVINIFFVENYQYCGSAFYPSSRIDRIMMKSTCTSENNPTTLIHEFGHYFGLPHTHDRGDELVDGSNCTSAGDKICDTPADPNLFGKLSFECTYVGTERDANGHVYNPSVDNYMSYAYNFCQDRFTPQQMNIMTYVAVNERNYLTCPSQRKPTIQTEPVTNISSNEASFNGIITDIGSDDITEHGFCYSRINNTPTLSDKVFNMGVYRASSFSASFSGLEANTTYYVRAYAKNSIGLSYGNVQVFTTNLKSEFTIESLEVKDVTSTSANFYGKVDIVGEVPVEYGFCYATFQNPTINDNKINIGTTVTSINSFSSTITSLNSSTTYYMRAYIQAGGTVKYGENLSFTTKIKDVDWYNTPERRSNWWDSLENQWKMAFNDKVLSYGRSLSKPSDSEILSIFQLKSLDVNNYQKTSDEKLTNLSGIQHLTNLEVLITFRNVINDLSPIQYLTNLKEFDCHSNQIHSLEPISNLTNLTSIDFQDNGISSLKPLEKLTNLEFLNCSLNQISSLNYISELTKLSYLSCTDNQINDLSPIQDLNLSITKLVCFRNKINNLEPLRYFNNLYYLDFGDNEISDLEPVQNITSLERIYFSGNHISTLQPFTNLTNLTWIDGRTNLITNLAGIENLTKLRNLRIKIGNNIPNEEIKRIEDLLGITIQ